MTAHNPIKKMLNGNVTLNFDPQVGDKAHVLYYSDIKPCTVIKRTKKFVWIQMDNYKLAEGERPNIIPGGFAGHCTNQRSLKYDITRNLEVQLVSLVFEILVDGAGVVIIAQTQLH